MDYKRKLLINFLRKADSKGLGVSISFSDEDEVKAKSIAFDIQNKDDPDERAQKVEISGGKIWIRHARAIYPPTVKLVLGNGNLADKIYYKELLLANVNIMTGDCIMNTEVLDDFKYPEACLTTLAFKAKEKEEEEE